MNCIYGIAILAALSVFDASIPGDIRAQESSDALSLSVGGWFIRPVESGTGAAEIFSISSASERNWIPAVVPGNIQADLEASRLRIHTADQSKDAAVVEVRINGTTFEQTLPKGLGIQETDPAHLAFPATLVLPLPENVLRQGKNLLEVRVKNDGWFSWDSLDCIVND